MKADNVIIHTDGASRGNPGPASIGVTIKDAAGNLLESISRYIGITTNNQAEYRAVIAGLEKATDLKARRVTLLADSELVVKQLNGRYKVKNTALRPLYQQVVKLAASLDSLSISYIPRRLNAEADALANKALDRR